MEAPSKPAPRPLAMVPLAVLVVALLVAGSVAAAVHHPKAATATVVTPADFQRLVDGIDGVSVAVPARWRVLSLTTGQLGQDFDALKATAPDLSALLDLAKANLAQIRPGLFAIDATTRTSLFTYGVEAAGINKIRDIPPADVTAPLVKGGAKNVQAVRIHLRVGDGERVTAQLTIGAVTVTEWLDYFVLHKRVIAVVFASRGAQPPASLFRQIEATLAAA